MAEHVRRQQVPGPPVRRFRPSQLFLRSVDSLVAWISLVNQSLKQAHLIGEVPESLIVG